VTVFRSPETSVYELLNTYDVHHTPLIVGVSGGVDSICLLAILAQYAPTRHLDLHVVHVHHGIRGADADQDAAFVRDFASRLGLPLTIRHVDIPKLAAQPGVSVEEAARQWRYAILGKEAQRIGTPWIAVAHNADDQVETVLMHILRGTGLAGLRGMRPLTWYAHLRLPLVPDQQQPDKHNLWLLRPLLYTRRKDIEAWAREKGLAYRFDRSNLDTTYFRNRLRHEILPLLERVNPQVRNALFTTAELAAADFDVLHPLTQSAWAALRLDEGAGWVRFHLAGWRAQPLAVRSGLLRDAVMTLRRELRDIGFEHVERARQFLEAPNMPAGSEYTLPAGLVIRREYTTFWVGEQDAGPAWDVPQVEAPFDIPGPGTYPLGNGWILRVTILPREDVGDSWRRNPNPWVGYFDANTLAWPLRIRVRKQGERIEPLGMPGKHILVSEIMINAKVPRWARARWPLLIGHDGTIYWIVGIRQAHTGRITERTKRIAILHAERAR